MMPSEEALLQKLITFHSRFGKVYSVGFYGTDDGSSGTFNRHLTRGCGRLRVAFTWGFVGLVGVLPVEAESSSSSGIHCLMACHGGSVGTIFSRITTQRHIHFRLPNASMRSELFAHHLPNPDRVTADYSVLAELPRGFSGGDILHLCVNAIYGGVWIRIR